MSRFAIPRAPAACWRRPLLHKRNSHSSAHRRNCSSNDVRFGWISEVPYLPPWDGGVGDTLCELFPRRPGSHTRCMSSTRLGGFWVSQGRDWVFGPALFGLTRAQDLSEEAFDFPEAVFHPRCQSALGGERSELAFPGFRRRHEC